MKIELGVRGSVDAINHILLKVNDDWFDTPHNEVEDTLHEKMYQMATKNGGSWLGG